VSLTNLLPGLREVRTPLASGYVWLLIAWIWWSDRLRHPGGSWQALFEQVHTLGGFVGHAAELAALSFGAYLVGAVWEGIAGPLGRVAYLLLTMERGHRHLRLPWSDRPSIYTMRRMVEEAVDRWQREHQAAEQGERSIDWQRYLDESWEEVGRLPVRLAVKEPDLWGMWDRLDAESQFRMTLAGPVIALAITLGLRLHPVWYLGIFAGVLLLGLAQRKRVAATGLLVQAVRSGVPAAQLDTLAALEATEQLHEPVPGAERPTRFRRFLTFWRDEFVVAPWLKTAPTPANRGSD